MRNIICAIDGASRRSGKSDGIAVGAAVLFDSNNMNYITSQWIHESSNSNVNATSQRGELYGLIAGLDQILDLKAPYGSVYLVTDSEYLFNAVSKQWYISWESKGWKTSTGEPVKNIDLWMEVVDKLQYFDSDVLIPYHIKGHVFPFGKVEARKLVESDSTCKMLYNALEAKMNAERDARHDSFNKALDTFRRNHGFTPPEETFKKFILANMVVDCKATVVIDDINSVR